MEEQLKLTWIYAEPEAAAEAQLVPPPEEELAALYQLAKRGQIIEIQKMAVSLKGLGEVYLPYASKLQALAEGFEIAQIKTFVERYIHEK